MQVRKVAVVATGTLAAAAAMGSTPAFAADSATGTPELAPATIGVVDYEGTHQASDEAMRELAEYWLTVAPEQTWSAPWEQVPPQILSIGSGSAFSVAPWQICGSTAVAGVGASVPIASPNTVLGDCTNGNIDIAGDGGDALISILDNTAISALAWQICGSTAVAGVGAAVPIASPNTVTGDCDNGNITIGTPEEGEPEYPPVYNDNDYPYHQYAPEGDAAEAAADAEQTVVPSSAPWEQEPPQILSAGSGSAVSAAAWQICGSSAVAGVGLTAPVASPNTVLGDCNNGNIDIHGDGGDALFSVLDNSALSVASWQPCGSSVVAGVGATIPLASPNTVTGDCNNGNISIG